MKKLPTGLIVALLIGSLLNHSAAASAGRAEKPGREVVVGVDEAGDWGENVTDDLGAIGDSLGQDLVGASIEMADARTVNFILKLNSLPPWGGVPEVTRYVWDLSVDRTYFMLDGRFTNYSRGACDPTYEQCPPARDPGLYPFIIHDECGPSMIGAVCHEIALVHARFDPSTGTITVPVPLKLIGAEPGSRIEAGRGNFFYTFGGSVVATPAVWRTCVPVALNCYDTWPMDTLEVTRTFVVPRR